jgi:hypothetical protein
MRSLALLLPLLSACSAPAGPGGIRASVFFFLTADCPIANAFAPEIKRIVEDYALRGVAFSMVYTDLSQTAEAARRHAAEYGYTSPVRLDEGRLLSRRYGITVTPEVVVVDLNGERRYRGRIDDRYLAPGRYRLQPTTRELRDAIEAVLAGRPVAVAQTPAAGCPLTD